MAHAVFYFTVIVEMGLNINEVTSLVSFVYMFYKMYVLLYTHLLCILQCISLSCCMFDIFNIYICAYIYINICTYIYIYTHTDIDIDICYY